MDKKVTVILMTWKRISMLKETLRDLEAQTYKDFDLYISNGNLEHARYVDKFTNQFKNKLSIRVSHDGNEQKSFRRLLAARKMAQEGTEIVLFIDDDIELPPTYVEKALSQYEPKAYKSGFAWRFYENGKNYYKYRKRRFDNKLVIHYCGTGISMVDASIFLEDGLFDVPEGALGIEDLWLSYYAQQIMGWKLAYMEVPKGTIIGGDDAVALFKTYLNSKYSKADFLKDLVKMGWKL